MDANYGSLLFMYTSISDIQIHRLVVRCLHNRLFQLTNNKKLSFDRNIMSLYGSINFPWPITFDSKFVLKKEVVWSNPFSICYTSITSMTKEALLYAIRPYKALTICFKRGCLYKHLVFNRNLFRQQLEINQKYRYSIHNH